MTPFRFAKRALDKTRVATAFAADTPPEDGLIQFGGGLAFPGELPNIVNEAILAAQNRTETMQYGPLFGLRDLREQIVNYLRENGLETGIENLLVVNGAKHALDLACRVFLEPGDGVIVTAPTYLTAIDILRTHGAAFVTVPLDDDGMCVDALEQMLRERRSSRLPIPKLLFDVMDFHNPTGVTLAAPRREKLVALAEEFNFVILEDDPYRRIRFEGESRPPLKSWDRNGHVIGLGTVSKILAPGIRVGWANGDPKLISQMAAQKSDGGSSPFNQHIVASLFKSGAIDKHIDRVRPVLQLHRDAMVHAFRTHLPEVAIRVPNGGYFLWAGFPASTDSEDLTRAARRHGVVVFSGQRCFPMDNPSHHIRLAYSFCEIDDIDAGVRKIAAAYYELADDSLRRVHEALKSHN